MHVLVLNCGSSSVKFSIHDASCGEELMHGTLQGIDEEQGTLQAHGTRTPAVERRLHLADHRAALQQVVELIDGHIEVDAIGHRVVHGGAQFREPVRIDDQVLAAIAQLDRLAPLHNPSNRLGIEMAMAVWPQVPQFAVFDTAFHQTLPPHTYRYAVPEHWYRDLGVRRYGFHGTSHRYVSREAARLLGRDPASLNLVSLHLGNGASACAVRGGVCMDTSMGMTPLEGLVMGSRGGDLDPGILLHLLRQGASVDDLDAELNHACGLRGLCGENDLRAVHELADAGDTSAQLALDLFCYRVRKYIGAYLAVLGRIDALVFTAGIGEHDARVRARILDGMEPLGMCLDAGRNASRSMHPRAIHATTGSVAILVVPTREELEIARQVTEYLAHDM